MAKQTLLGHDLGDELVDSWTQEKVTCWLKEKGWGQFASTFEAHGICRERFFQITLAELVHYLPRSVTTYCERRRLLNEIRLLVPSSKWTTPSTPTNISINTNIHDYNSRLGGFDQVGVIPPNSSSSSISSSKSSSINSATCISPSEFQQQLQLQQYQQPQPQPLGSPHLTTTTTRDSGIGYFSHYSAGSSSSSSPSLSPCSNEYHILKKQTNGSPTRTSYSPKAALNKLKNTFRSSMNPQQPSSPSSRHESAIDVPTIPARVSSTPDKISKFWHTYTHWHTTSPKRTSPSSFHIPPLSTPKTITSQKIQITGDKETWYSLNVTNMRDPVAIKKHMLKRMNYIDDHTNYHYFYENGSNPDTPMDPQELMYLCSVADASANQRILIKHVPKLFQPPPPPPPPPPPKYALSTPELGQSPSADPPRSPHFKPLSRKTATRPKMQKKHASVGVQLSDPPTPDYLDHQQRRKSIPTIIALPPSPQKESVGLWAIAPTSLPKKTTSPYWGERPPAEVVFKHMEDYFDSKDLDKEVVVPIEPTNKLTHTKSIRVVAREASKKYMRNNSTSSSSSSSSSSKKTMVRRKSTKLWGQKVVQVKSRSTDMISRLPSVSEHMRLSHHTTDDNEVQWIRGKLIGKGSFGRVYLAFNVGTGEVIAVKQVEIPKTASDLLNEHQHDMVESLYGEIMMLRDLDHENIVQYLGYGHDETEGMIHIFLEYVSGGSVASRLALQGAFDEPLTTYFTRQICSGLAYLHARNILHRDIKAANILVEVDGVCKISDFGLSKKNDYDEVYDQNSRMSLRGSIYWMAPEVVKNEPYSAKVDIWSLGCTVLEMLTGERPWISLNQIAALYNLGKLNAPTLPDDISDCAKDFLRQCFIIDPVKRPTATDLLKHPFLVLDTSFQFKDYVDKGKV